MNQDRVKEILLATEGCDAEFAVVFSGKSNAKVNGLYKPDKAEILLHNKNFDSDDQLVYTALHEYAHHLHHSLSGGLGHARPHTQEFWAIFHRLVRSAEEKGFYANVFDSDPDFLELTRRIKESCIKANGEILLEFGRLLADAAELCRKHRARFEDYVERVLGIPRATATMAVAARNSGLDPSLGWDGLKYVASIRDEETRAKAIEALGAGASPSSVKGYLKTAETPENPAERLLAEKARIEKTIRSLTSRLEQIDEKLSEL